MEKVFNLFEVLNPAIGVIYAWFFECIAVKTVKTTKFIPK